MGEGGKRLDYWLIMYLTCTWISPQYCAVSEEYWYWYSYRTSVALNLMRHTNAMQVE